MRTRGKDSAASCRSTAMTEVTFSSGGGSAQRREGGGGRLFSPMVVAPYGRTEKSSKRGVACIKRNKPPTAGWMVDDGGNGIKPQIPCPAPASLWGQGYSTQENAPRLVAGEQASPRPRLVLGAADLSSSPRNKLEPHSSSLQELASVAVVVGIHPAFLQLLSASGNTKGNSGSACRARIRLSCVIVIPVSISTAGLCLSRRQWYGILTRDPTRSFSLRLFSEETKPVLVQFPSYSQLYTLAAPRQTCTQCNECELTVLLPLLRCMFCVPFAVADASWGGKCPNRHGPKKNVAASEKAGPKVKKRA